MGEDVRIGEAEETGRDETSTAATQTRLQVRPALTDTRLVSVCINVDKM